MPWSFNFEVTKVTSRFQKVTNNQLYRHSVLCRHYSQFLWCLCAPPIKDPWYSALQDLATRKIWLIFKAFGDHYFVGYFSFWANFWTKLQI